jgi:hypothetical protein
MIVLPPIPENVIICLFRCTEVRGRSHCALNPITGMFIRDRGLRLGYKHTEEGQLCKMKAKVGVLRASES